MKITPYILFLGLLHGVADACTGFLLVSLALTQRAVTIHQAGLFVVTYNVLAFALQPAFGWGLDALRHPRKYSWGAAGGLALIGGALLIGRFMPLAAIFLAGSGSALFHVGAGAMAMSERRALHCGAFAAPGVIGQGLGMSIALVSRPVLPVFVTLAVVVTVLLVVARPPELTIDATEPQAVPAPKLSQLQGTLLLLTLAIALRSSVWTLWEALIKNDALLVVTLPLAAGAGKLMGGLLADRWGATRYAIGALALSGPLLMSADQNPGHLSRYVLILLGIACLQSATPGALVALKTALPTRPAVAAGLGFGLAIALGGLPDLLQMSIQPWILPISLTSALLFYLVTPTLQHRSVPALPPAPTDVPKHSVQP